jgi:hypothetical protein
MEENKDLEQKVKNFTVDDDLDLFFNDFIKKGHIEKEEEVVPGFKIKLKVLNTGESLSAETIMKTEQGVPYDIVQKVRAASILSQAILSINGLQIAKDGDNAEITKLKRTGLYKRLLDMPAYVIQKAFDLYIDAVTEQTRLYSDSEGTTEKVKNF